MNECFSLCLVSEACDQKMDYSFKSSLLGEVPHISFKHICQDQSERATQLYIFGIFGVGARCHSIEVTRA